MSLVGFVPVTGPVTLPTSSMTELMTGAAGGRVSTLMTYPAVWALALPTASVAVKVNVCAPLLSAGDGVKLHAPPVAVTLPICTPLSKIFTVAPASAVPLSVGCASLVNPPLATGVAALPTSSRMLVSTGSAGGVVSTVRLKLVDDTLVLPAASVACAVKLCAPAVSGGVSTMLQLPLPSAVPVPTRVVPS